MVLQFFLLILQILLLQTNDFPVKELDLKESSSSNSSKLINNMIIMWKLSSLQPFIMNGLSGAIGLTALKENVGNSVFEKGPETLLNLSVSIIGVKCFHVNT